MLKALLMVDPRAILCDLGNVGLELHLLPIEAKLWFRAWGLLDVKVLCFSASGFRALKISGLCGIQGFGCIGPGQRFMFERFGLWY